MARVTKEYDERKNEFLDTAQMLFYSQGYDQTSVNAIIDHMGVSKGTFYHYFESKEQLLDSLIERLAGQILVQINESIDDPGMDAITKLNRMFESSAATKADNRELILTVLRTVYNDRNIMMRQKMTTRQVAVGGPLMSRIIHQGIAEGVFNTAHPDHIADLIFGLSNGWGEKFASLMLTLEDHPENKALIFQNVEIFEDAIERLLGAPSGSIKLGSRDTLERILG